MKNYKTILSLMIVSLVLMPFVAFAQPEQAQNRGNSATIMAEVIDNEPIAPEQANVNIQNQGEAQMLRVGAQDEVTINQETGIPVAAQTQAQNQFQGSNASSQGEQRRSIVANAVQEMLMLAERDPEFGPQIAIIAQTQTQKQEEAEAIIEKAKNRSQFKKLLFGPDYTNLNLVKEKLLDHSNKIAELRAVAEEMAITNDVEAQLLFEQVRNMEAVKASLENEVDSELSRPSLFGWLRRLFNR